MTQYGAAVNTVPTYLLPAYSVILERSASQVADRLRELAGKGVEVDLFDHLETTRRLIGRSQSYIQIQRKAFLVPDEWTVEWMRLVDEIARGGTKCQYIVLMTKPAMQSELVKLRSMCAYLTKRKFIFALCDEYAVLDALGGKMPTKGNVEVFDDTVVKLQSVPDGQYQGGITLNMVLNDLREREDLRRFVAAVTRLAQKMPSQSAGKTPLPYGQRAPDSLDG
jgi:hypothetical protein